MRHITSHITGYDIIPQSIGKHDVGPFKPPPGTIPGPYKTYISAHLFHEVVGTLSMGHLPNTFCFISPSNLLHLPNNLLHIPNRLLHFPQKFLTSPTLFCGTLSKTKTQFYKIFPLFLHLWSLGTHSPSKTDEFSEKFQTAFGPPLIFGKSYCVFFGIHDRRTVYNGKNLQYKFLEFQNFSENSSVLEEVGFPNCRQHDNIHQWCNTTSNAP